ncbi:MAG: hypothetical protein GY811_04075 [Myxococcales bacterium]|nr:hypothetical protein [Myxococcales bacterium]
MSEEEEPIMSNDYRMLCDPDILAKFNEVAVEGPCTVYVYATETWGGPESKEFISHPVTDPTWGWIYGLACESQQYTLDGQHCHFSGIELSDVIDGYQVILLYLDS